MAKMDSLYQHLNVTLVKFGDFHDLLSIDESMVPYYSLLSAKIFVKNNTLCIH